MTLNRFIKWQKTYIFKKSLALDKISRVVLPHPRLENRGLSILD